MAEPPEGPGLEITNRQELEAWLKTQPREVAVVIAARAALRVLPLVARESRMLDPGLFARSSSEAFRATAIAWVAATYSNCPIAAAVAVFAATTDFIGAAVAAAVRTATAATTAEAAAAAAYTAFAVADAVAFDHINASFPDAAATWEAVSLDAAFIVEDGDSRKRAAERAGELARKAPLWPSGPPHWAMNRWRRLQDVLLGPDYQEEGWQVWIDWYQRRLDGVSDPEKIELAFLLLDDLKKWDDGPAPANAEIAKRVEHASGKGRKEPTEPSKEVLELAPPPPVENIPSVFTYAVNAAGQIDLASGPQNVPFIAHPGDEKVHRRWLDAARKLADRLATDLRAQKFNANPQYRERLEQYAADLPSDPDDGNIVLVDAEARALHSLFLAETSALNEAFAARLRSFLETHFALLAFYEDEMQRFHAAARKGSLAAPFPREAVQKVSAVVVANTPTVFAQRVSDGLKEVAREAPKVELEPEDLRANAPIQPPPYPYGDVDYEKTRRLGVGGSINALYRAVWERAKDPEKAAAMILIAKEMYHQGKPIFEYLRQIAAM